MRHKNLLFLLARDPVKNTLANVYVLVYLHERSLPTAGRLQFRKIKNKIPVIFKQIYLLYWILLEELNLGS